MSSFFSSLVGSYSAQMLKKHQTEKAQHIQSLTGQLDTLVQAAAEGRVRPEYMDSVKEQIDDLQDEIAGKKSKGGFHLSNLIGKFQDTGRRGAGKETQPNQQGKGATPTGAAVAPSAPSNLGQPPTRQAAAAPAMAAAQPQGASSTFGGAVTNQRTPDEMAESAGDVKIREEIKDFHARAQSLSQDLFGKGLTELNPQEKQQAIRFAYSLPDAPIHPIAIVRPDGKTVPALQHEDGSVTGADGKLVKDPVLYEKGAGFENRVNVLPGGQLQSVYVNKDTHEVFDANTNERVERPSLLPPASYLPTTASGVSIEPSFIPDPNHPGQFIQGPAVTRKTTTTHAKAIPGEAGAAPPTRRAVPAARPSGRGGPVASAPPARASGPYPWAAPKSAVQTPAQLDARVNATMSTFRKNLTDANTTLAQARRQLASLQKEQRGEGVMKKAERNLLGVGGAGPDVSGAEAAVQQAQTKAANAQRAVTFVESMRQSIIEGTADPETVEKRAQELAATGKLHVPKGGTPPPGVVSRNLP